jgi:hypothetical protein
MRLRKLYPEVALVTFLMGLSVSYGMHAVATRLFGTTEEVPRQELFDEATESRDVYSAILQQSFIRHRYRTVVIETASADCLPMDRDFNMSGSPTVQELYARERAVLPVELDAVADYVQKNQAQGELFLEGLGIPNELIAREDVAKFFETGGGGWETFYKRYPGSLGLVSFSKVGFNSRHDQAFVYVAKTCQWLCGDGEHVLLEKEGGQWMVKVVHEIWES